MFYTEDEDQNNFRLLVTNKHIQSTKQRKKIKVVTYSSIPRKNIFRSNNGIERTCIQIWKKKSWPEDQHYNKFPDNLSDLKKQMILDGYLH